MGEAMSPEEFGKINIFSRKNQGPNFRPTQLREIGEIEEGLTDVRKKSRSDGMPAVGLGIIKQHGSNAVEVGELIRQKDERPSARNPQEFQNKFALR